MKSKKIANIVFYKFNGEDGAREQACIFYNDGTVQNCSYDDGIDAVLEFAKNQKINTKEEITELINNKFIHVMSGNEFEKNFQKFIVNEEQPVVAVDEDNLQLPIPVAKENKDKVEIEDYVDNVDNGYNFNMPTPIVLNDEKKEEDSKKSSNTNATSTPVPIVFADEKKEDKTIDNDKKSTNESKKPTYIDLANTDYEDEKDNKKANEIKNNVVTPMPSQKQNNNFNKENSNTRNNTERVPLKAANEVNTKSKKKKNGIFSKVKNFFHRTKVRFGAALLAVVLAFTGGAALNKNNKIGKFFSNTITKLTNKSNIDGNLVRGNNDYYDNYTYNQLQEVNNNQAQKSAMQQVYNALQAFNGDFANKHVEAGKDVKAALSFTEMNALHQAYNNYSNEDITAIFNGTRINAHEFSQAYRNANLQLMGAHVIETRDAAVDMLGLINSEEGKEFYNKYHEMFLQIKASGQDKIDKINSWRQSLLEDFPISEEVREIGIAHSDNRYVAPYKASIVPMVSAVEIMYQNLAYDNTLSDKIINYFNDVGLCNIVDDTFERIERVTEIAPENNEEPLYIQYENAMVSELEAQGNYAIDDEHRELTKLDAFQNAVNEHGHNGLASQGSYSTGGSATESYTTVETETVTDTKVDKKVEKTKTSDREEAIKKSSKEKVEKAEEKVDKEIEKENAEAKETAEKQAEEKRQELQSEADKQAEIIQEQIAQDDKDLQQDIEQANDQINQNNADTDTTNDKPVNEKDFGDHNVDFDDNHSDSNGNLDNSVKDLTTDSTGDKTNQPLPDPNVTGESFEKNYPESVGDPFESTPETSAPAQSKPVEQQQEVAVPENTSDQADSVIEYEEPVEETIDYVDASAIISNEELANMIVESMADVPSEDVEGYQYVIK